MTNVRSVSAGADFYLALKMDGTLWANGYNGDGQLGDGRTMPCLIPEQVRSGVQDMAAGPYYQSIILDENGSLWTTGANANGELGDGTTTRQTTPVRILSSAF